MAEARSPTRPEGGEMGETEQMSLVDKAIIALRSLIMSGAVMPGMRLA